MAVVDIRRASVDFLDGARGLTVAVCVDNLSGVNIRCSQVDVRSEKIATHLYIGCKVATIA